MTSLDNQLFTVEEALTRLGENKEQGCLLVSKGVDLIIIFVQDGFVLNAASSRKNGKDAVDQALHLAEASYQWIRGVKPPDPTHNIYLHIQEFVVKHGDVLKAKAAEASKLSDTGKLGNTSKIKAKGEETVSATKYRYYLIPDDQPTTKIFLTKTATVLGRDKSSDLVIDDFNVSGRHCILDIRNRGLFVLDLDSTNGSYVNGVLIEDGYVNPGDVLELGSYRVTVNRELPKE